MLIKDVEEEGGGMDAGLVTISTATTLPVSQKESFMKS